MRQNLFVVAIYCLVAFPLLLGTSAEAAELFVGPTGTAQGNGTRQSPWSLQTALDHPSVVKPGDTITVLGGTYAGRFVSRLNGTSASPIVVRSAPGEDVRLDGYVKTKLLEALGSATAYNSSLARIAELDTIKSGGILLIDDEQLQIGSLQPSGYRYLVRGWNGSCAATSGTCPAHAANTDVYPLGGVLEIYGSNTTFIGFDVFQSAGARSVSSTGSALFGSTLGSGVGTYGPGVKVVNFLIHDNASGIGAWNGASDSAYYGNVIWNNGWNAPDRGHGHGIYTQNKDGRKLFRRNIVFHSFGNVLQQYGSDQSFLFNFDWEENVFFNGRTLFGGSSPIQSLNLKGNLTYKDPIELGYSNGDNSGARITNNYLMGGLSIHLFKDVQAFDNTIYGGPSLRFDAAVPNGFSDYVFDRNTYYAKALSYPYIFTGVYTNPASDCPSFWFNRTSPGFGYGSCADNDNSWQDRVGYDRNGTLIAQARSGQKTFLQVNEYDSQRATLVVYNWDKANTVSFDPAGFLKAGDRYEVRSVLDYFNDRTTGTYAGGQLAVSVTGHNVAPPTNWSTALGPNTFPEFGVFTLKRVSDPAPGAPDNLQVLP